ncbi:MAG TPA: helix-turn-helix transcriptional regulator [Phenylobacterium sp.]|nr:helix-turn-helix transcriptional regulator [Phenylobacterium sp.]
MRILTRQREEPLMATETRTPRSGAVDVALGERVRRRRRELGLSQSALGGKLGITFQQVQKYENGANRVSASMLVKLSDALAIPVMQLLHDVDPGAPPADPESDAARLLAAFGKIRSPEVRAAILVLVTGLVAR